MSGGTKSVLTLHVTLAEVTPEVWRRLLVPGAAGLDRVHRMLQAAMGWEESHLHAFDIAGTRYSPLHEDAGDDELDEGAATLEDALGDERSFIYVYDFGDSWRHEVVVESQTRLAGGLTFAVCLDGANACPPENCGGASGYAELVRVLSDPKEAEHDRMRSWVGRGFDPAAFDIAVANVSLQAAR